MPIPQRLKSRFFLIAIILVVFASFAGVFAGLALRTRSLLNESILLQARSHFQGILLTRDWNAEHGGVFVLKGEGVESNPYLEAPDLLTEDGRVLTKKNPALMTREISKLANLRGGMVFNVTSLNPLNPNNIPDMFEKASLKAFEAGTKEAHEFAQLDGMTVFRYMAPLKTTQSCLTCHAKQGYKLGDIRGGISVTLSIRDLQEKWNENLKEIIVYGVVITFLVVVTVSLLIVRLVKMLNRARSEMEQIAISDGLTGIFNRRHGMKLLEIEVNRAKRLKHPLCCLMVDIDHFKKINDTYGHDAGDQVLIELTAGLQEMLRKYDIFFRYGGEELVIIFPNLDMSQAYASAERLRLWCEELSVSTDGGDREIRLTFSGGLACLAGEDDKGEAILKRADTALYMAKDNGRNRIEEML